MADADQERIRALEYELETLTAQYKEAVGQCYAFAHELKKYNNPYWSVFATRWKLEAKRIGLDV